MKILVLVTLSILGGLLLYAFLYLKPTEKNLVRKGILPPIGSTTLDDIRRLKHHPKYSEWALYRLMAMPEHENKPHEELKKILDSL